MVQFVIPGAPVPFARAGSFGTRRFTPTKQRDYMLQVRAMAFEAMRGLLAEATRVSRFALVSYNDEGIITDAQWVELLRDYVHEKHEFPYDCFKGSRNLRNRKDKVMERMYLVSRPPHPPRPPHGGPP